ncbi:unnamed protein product [Phytophthora fragariaefolia]|uniref:Unnamed protein product n=1 Tax=Phytophthora fragariaefolia TaxID=1490495 RepID=A0A9W6XQ31_9STRA|nr:unnamed protein product [Phytophthora fragariaefolia]
MFLLNFAEGNFYGVQPGETCHEWHAQQGQEMRIRIDQVHLEVGLPVLPSDGYDLESVAAEAAYEKQALLEEMGVEFYASGSQECSTLESAPQVVKRAKVAPQVAVHPGVYARPLEPLNRLNETPLMPG